MRSSSFLPMFVAAAGACAALLTGPLEQPRNSAGQPDLVESRAADQPELAEGLEVFTPFVGHTWVIETRWLGDESVKASNEYRSLMGGRYVEAITKAVSTDGQLYQRYRTVFAHDDDTGIISAYTFAYDGAVAVSPVEIGNPAEDVEHPPLRSGFVQESGEKRVEIRQEVQMLDDRTGYAWRVFSAEPGSTRFNLLMEGVWKRGERLED